MSRFDPDVLAVRDLPPGRPEPTDESVSRTWHAVTRRLATRRSRSRRWLVPIAAAGVVALVVAGAALFAPDRHRTPPTPLTPQQVMDQLIGRAAGIEPVPVPAGRLLYVRTLSTASREPAAQTLETWFDGETIMPQRIRVDGKDTPIDTPPDKPGSVAEDNRNIVARGGDWYFPTPRWLADVPTDPVALRARLDEETFGSFTRPRFLPEGGPMPSLATMFSRSEPRLPPELRVGLYRMIAGLDGLTVSEVIVDGRRCWAVGQVGDGGLTVSLLFDAETARVIGQRRVGSRVAGPKGGSPRYDLDAVRQSVWTFAVVPDTNTPE